MHVHNHCHCIFTLYLHNYLPGDFIFAPPITLQSPYSNDIPLDSIAKQISNSVRVIFTDF